MAERLDALIAREYTDRDGNKKTSWTKIGVAFPLQNGGYSVSLEALPLPTMSERGLETRIVLKVPQPRDDRAAPCQKSYAEQSRGAARNSREDLDDEIPF